MSKGGKDKGQDQFPADSDLIRRFKLGDRQVFSQLVERYSCRIYNTILRMIKDPREAEDLTQEAFLSAFKSLNRFREQSGFYTWLYRIAVNKTLNRLKVNRRTLAILNSSIETSEGSIQKELADDSMDPQKHLNREELNRAIEKAIAGLSRANRVVFVMREIEGFSYEDISQMLGLKEQAVRTRVHRARRELQSVLKKYLERTP